MQLDPNPTTRVASHRAPRRGWHAGTVTRIAVVVVVALAVVAVKLAGGHSGTAARPQISHPPPIRYLGVFEPDTPGTYASVSEFGQKIGRQPNIVLYYRGWGQPFDAAFAQTAASHGALPLVQMDPTDIPLSRIAAGTDDAYLASFARKVARFGHPVVIGFGHEMNGYWYSWGYGNARPADFIAAWRHIVTLFRQHGATNVRWLWDVNSKSKRTGPVHDWWPGARYVTWVGIDGYYYLPGENFANIFDPVIADIRRFTKDPILIGETAVGPQAGQIQGIRNLLAGVRAGHILGFVWFDKNKHGGIYQQNWRLEDSPAAVTAFRSALRGS
ncbi:MAG: glycosyl hydrolase [Actinomycetota bacterium]